MIESQLARLAAILTALVTSTGSAIAQQSNYLTSNVPLVLLSANDERPARVMSRRPPNNPRDSITVIRLTSDDPPVTKTVYGTVPNSIFGPPRMAIVGGGRFGIVSNNADTPAVDADEQKDVLSTISVIDLESSSLDVIATHEVPGEPQMVVAHPDDDRFLVNTFDTLYMFRLSRDNVTEVAKATMPAPTIGFDISRTGDVVLTSAFPDEAHIFEIHDDSIEYRSQVLVGDDAPPLEVPFTPRISPTGDVAILLTGGGNPLTGELDEVVLIDMTTTPPQVSARLPDVADGLEGVAIHPDGHVAVVGCLDDHLAVIDLTSDGPRILYYLDAVGFPEGIEFSPDGSLLFVGLASRHHLAVYDVDGFTLTKKPHVLRTGQGPSSLAISRFDY